MKLLLIATLFSSFAFADALKVENFAEMKTNISANIDQRIAQLQSHKSCVQGAQDKEALKACRMKHKESMKSLHEENKGERKDWKANKKMKREKMKAEKKAKKTM